MPRLPVSEPRQSLSVTPGPRLDPGRFAATVAGGVTSAGALIEGTAKTLLEAEDRKRDARLTAEADRRMGAAAVGLLELELDFERDPDFTDARGRFDARAGQLKARIFDGVEDPDLKAYLEQRYSQASLLTGTKVARGAFRKETSAAVAVLEQNLDVYARAAAQALDQPTRDFWLAQGKQAIAGKAAAGYIALDAAGTRERGFLSRIEEHAARQLINRDPEAAAAALLDPETFPSLDPDKALQLHEQATRRAEAVQANAVRQAEKTERAAEEALRRAQDDADLDITTRILAEGTGAGDAAERPVTEAEIVSANMRADQKAAAMRLLRAERAPEDDPATVLDLARDAALGAASVDRRIRDALAAGRLKGETAVSLRRTLSSAQRQGGPFARDDVQRARAQIDQVVGGTRGPMAILDTAESERTQNALRFYDDLILRQEEQGQLDPRAASEEAIARFRQAPPDPTSLPAPLDLAGSRAAPDFEATRAAIVGKLDDGTYSREQAARELQLLDALEDAFQARASRATFDNRNPQRAPR